MKLTQTSETGFTGRHMLLTMLGFFGVIVSVNITMAVMSATSWTGLVVTNSYVASQEFEEKRLAHVAQQEAGWRSGFAFDGATARLSVIDAAGAPRWLGVVEARFHRPVGGHDDQDLVLERQADGSYSAPLQLGAGVWDVEIFAAETDLGPFALRDRFSVGGAGQ